MSERRAATHNGRAGKHGAYSAKHNDRQFDVSTADHIDPTLTPQNEVLRFGGDYGVDSIEEHELAFYEDHFGASLERKNAGYRNKGKAGQIRTMEQYYRSTRSCPEETLYTIGKDVDPQLLWTIYREHQAWKAETFPQCQTLDAALHVDEPDAMPHVHERSVWIGHDGRGEEVVGQAKALREMGVDAPDPDAKYGKFNNAKQTFTAECRRHFVDICRAHGLDIIEEPLPAKKVGLDLMEYKIQQTQERLAAIEEQQEAVASELGDLQTQLVDATTANEAVEAVNGVIQSLVQGAQQLQAKSAREELMEYLEPVKTFTGKETGDYKLTGENLQKLTRRISGAMDLTRQEFRMGRYGEESRWEPSQVERWFSEAKAALTKAYNTMSGVIANRLRDDLDIAQRARQAAETKLEAARTKIQDLTQKLKGITQERDSMKTFMQSQTIGGRSVLDLYQEQQRTAKLVQEFESQGGKVKPWKPKDQDQTRIHWEHER